MKSVLLTVVVLALGAPSVAQTLEVRVVTDANAASAMLPSSGGTVNVFMQVRLSGSPTDGLALLGVNLKNTGTASFDLCNQAAFLLTAPSTPVDIKGHFDRNGGLTNPPGNPLSGFSGTCDGNGGLLQIGGAQNTIGNPGAPVSYPSGTVLEAVAAGAFVNFATGTITLPAGTAGQTVILTPDTILATTLDAGQSGLVYHVTEVADVATAGSLTIAYGCLGPSCPRADVNCDGMVNAGDLLAVRAIGTWGTVNHGRADVNNDGVVNSGDLLAIRAIGTWGMNTGPCCSTCP
jgi:hypothetical protein